jgi:hypothetical protein
VYGVFDWNRFGGYARKTNFVLKALPKTVIPDGAKRQCKSFEKQIPFSQLSSE